ncbi:hypothetical protein BH10PLA2_BH10PLA2_14750 [soil metagenome]
MRPSRSWRRLGRITGNGTAGVMTGLARLMLAIVSFGRMGRALPMKGHKHVAG